MSNEVDDCFHSLEQVMEEDLENFLMYEEAHHSSSSSSSIHDAVAENEHQETQEESTHHRKKRNLTMDERRHIIDDLLIMLVNGKLPKGAITNTARKFGVNRSTIHNLWKSAKAQRAQNKGIDVKQRRKGKCGKKKKEYSEEMLQSVPLHLRSTIRSFAGSLKLPHATVQRLLQRGQLRSHTSSTKPCLTDQQKLARMQWVLSHIIPKTLTNPPTFQDMYNIIHIDEKWFYLNPDQRRFIMLPREDDPHRTTQSKRYKIKVMFLAVVSRPIYDESGNMIHDGKFGIFPFIEKVAAQRSSKNREKGTIETKAVERVTQKVIRDKIVNEVIPAIMSQWPAGMSKDIYIQQDNARPHIQPNDPVFIEAATKNGFNIQLIQQPPKSPDLNVLDLGFFRAIQALQYQSFPKNLDDLVEKVYASYEFFDPEVMKMTWLHLQYVMVEILKAKGGNNYKAPHHGKARLERLGLLPRNVEVDQSVIDEAVKYLNERLHEGLVEDNTEEDTGQVYNETQVEADNEQDCEVYDE